MLSNSLLTVLNRCHLICVDKDFGISGFIVDSESTHHKELAVCSIIQSSYNGKLIQQPMGQFYSLHHSQLKPQKVGKEWCCVLHSEMPRLTKNLAPVEEITEVLPSSAEFFLNCVASLILRRVTTYTHNLACILDLSIVLGELWHTPI